MTPISRLIPQSSGVNKIHRSEMETIRTNTSMVGAGNVPPMTPGNVIDARHMDDIRGDDLVSEILRDVNNSSPQQQPYTYRNEGSWQGQGQGQGQVQSHGQSHSDLMDPMMTQIHPSQYQDIPEEYNPERKRYMGGRYDEDDESPPIKEIKPKRGNNNLDGGDDTDFIGMLLEEIKMPLIVAILILGVGSSGLDESLSKIVPWLVNDGKMGVIGLILKAVVGGLIFYALKRIFL